MEDLGGGILVPRMDARDANGHAVSDLSPGLQLGGYNLAEAIGSGSFATVYRLARLGDAAAAPGGLIAPRAALKAIERRNLSPKSAALLSSEVRILHAISHPNIVNLHHVAASPRHVFLWMDCCDSDLGALIRSRPPGTLPDEEEAACLLSQLVDGLAYMRARRLLHRDIKPQNLLLCFSESPLDGLPAAAANGTVGHGAKVPPASAKHARLLIGDFGLARALEPLQMARTVCGSPLYMAPEVLRRCPYDAAAEMWSVGVCVHELLAGVPPFNGSNVPQLIEAIEASKGPPPPLAGVSEACASLLAGLLQPAPECRTTIEQLPVHRFLLRSAARSADLTLAPTAAQAPAAAVRAISPPSVANSWEPLDATIRSPSTAALPTSLFLGWDSASPDGMRPGGEAWAIVAALKEEVRMLEEQLRPPPSAFGPGGVEAARLRRLAALQQLARMLPATDKQGEALYQKKLDECKRLRSALKQAQQQQRAERAGFVITSSFKFGDRVVFVRRAGGAMPSAAAPAFVALREGGPGKPYFLARASESSLLGRRLHGHQSGQSSAHAQQQQLPPIALGSVVHVEHLLAPAEGGAAAALGLRPGAEYGVITAELSDTLAPEVVNIDERI